MPSRTRNVLPYWTYLEEYRHNKKTILRLFDRAILSGKLILGEHVSRFEKKFADYNQCTHAIGVNSGTDALFLALLGLGVGKGDEVVTVANTAIPTVSAIVATGATPEFVDITKDTLLMDPDKLESVITGKTKCIIPVHLYGNACNMDSIRRIARKHRVAVLEDCAQATGALFKGNKVGSMSEVAAYSFYPTKIIGAYGDGGMITTNDGRLADRIRRLRMYGTNGDYYSVFSGYNSRLDEIQAAILIWKLKKIEKYIAARRRIADRYTEHLTGSSYILPAVPQHNRHVWHLYVVQHDKRDTIIETCRKKGIQLAVHYRHPIHLQEGYRYLGYTKGSLPNTEKACNTVISLPIYPELTTHAQDRIIKALIESEAIL